MSDANGLRIAGRAVARSRPSLRTDSFILLLLVTVLLMACGRETPVAKPVGGIEPRFDALSITRGAALFGEHCAQCHGPQAQGHPDWQAPNDGSFVAAPPLNGTGNDWKRSRKDMIAVIKEGAKGKDDAPVMPAWSGRLSETEINDIVAWYQSLWPPQVFENWYKANRDAPKG